MELPQIGLDVINMACFVFSCVLLNMLQFFFLFFPLWKKRKRRITKLTQFRLDNQNNVLLKNVVRSYRRKHV